MNTTANHIIQHAHLHFHFNGNSDAFELQQEAGNWFTELLRKMEPELNSHSNSGQYFILQQLELEVDVLQKNWQELATGKLLLQLKQKIQLSKQQSNDAIQQSMSPRQHAEDIFVYFLQHGSLPWNADATILWNQQFSEVISNPTIQLVKQLLPLLMQHPEARHRVMDYVSFEQFVRMLLGHKSLLSAIQVQVLQDALLFQQTFEQQLSNKAIKQLHFHYLLESLAQKEGPTHVVNTAWPTMYRMLQQLPDYPAQVANISFNTASYQRLQHITAKENAEEAEHSIKLLQQRLNETSYSLEEATATTYYVANAGLVIVAAFLPAFFEKINCWKDGRWVHRAHAVCSLQYIATGNAYIQEFDLILPKIFCGLPVNQPISTDEYHLQPTEQKEVEEMLLSVIEHWSILQNTSVQGLRESFLKRKGKLILKNNEWHLLVEQQSYDMLLQHLPWNMQMIKLPWMQQMLVTEWIY